VNQEIVVLIEILNEKLEIIQGALDQSFVTSRIYEKMSLDVHELDVAFLNYFNQIKDVHGKDVFAGPGFYHRDEIISLQKIIAETQSAEALVLDRKKKDEFEQLKNDLSKRRNIQNKINQYNKV